MAKSSIKEAVFIALFLPPSLNSQVTATNNILLAIKSKVPRHNKYSIKNNQQVLTLYKARDKSKLKKGKKQSYLKLAAYSSKENSKGKSIRYKKSNNNKTKSGKYNKLPQLKLVISALIEDNKSKLATPRKLNSCKANLNKYRKYF